jgi:hypothetical protein
MHPGGPRIIIMSTGALTVMHSELLESMAAAGHDDMHLTGLVLQYLSQ